MTNVSTELLLSIDCGTQSVRALVFDLQGELIGRRQHVFDTYVTPRDNWLEHDADEFWRATGAVCRALFEERPDLQPRIGGVAVTTQRGSLVLVDEQGAAIRPFIIWLDQRRASRPPKAPLLWRAAFALARVSDTIDYLTREVERILLASVVEEGGTGTPHQEFSFYRAYAATLGRRTGEMHAALAVETDDPAFGTEPIAASDMKSWVDATRKQLTAAMKALERVLPNLEEAQAEAARSVLDAKAAVEARLKEIAGRKIDAAKTRLHGDYHLGQVVVVTDDFHILDFEGEPTRSIDERRAKMSPLKDVAGMLRSFDYAAWTIIDRLSHDHPAHAERLEAILGDWRRITVKAFLQNYLSAMQGVPSLPADRDEAEDLLELHLIEKALYEINYEAANRPRWLHIPLSGLAGLVEPASTKRRLLHGDD